MREGQNWKGSLTRYRDGRWIVHMCVCGRRVSRFTDTTDRARAVAILDAMIAEERRRLAAELDALPFMRYWREYAASPAAQRLEKRQFSQRRKAWESFSRWLNDAHPEIRDLKAVTRRTGEDYLDFLKTDLSNSTCNSYASWLRDVFWHFLREAGAKFNPWDAVGNLPYDTQRRRDLSPEEIGSLIDTAKSKGGEWALLFRLAAYTGMRLGECCRLEWKNIDLEKGLVQVVPHKTRGIVGDRPVTIPLHRELKKCLLAIPCRLRWGAVLPAIAKIYRERRHQLNKELNDIFDATGIERQTTVEGRKRKVCHASFHSLRHSFVSMAANMGVSLDVVRALVGHETTGMTRHYYHAQESLMRRAVGAIPVYDDEGKCVSQPERVDSRPASVRLLELKDALDNGLISRAEYDVLRSKILSGI